MKDYTSFDDQTLKFLWENDIPVPNIARALERTESSVRSRVHRLKLPQRTDAVPNGKKPPRIQIDRFCLNPECDNQIMICVGHKDRLYCSQRCANRVINARQRYDAMLKPTVKHEVRHCEWGSCGYLALPNSRFCYQISDLQGHGV